MQFLRFSSLGIALTLLPLTALAQADAQQPAIPATAPTAAAAAPVVADGPVMRSEFQAMVRDALLKEPDMIIKAVDKLREQQRVEAVQKTENAINANKALLYSDAGTPSVGDEKTADVTIVEFFDYHCGYCKHMLPIFTKLIKEDKKVRVVFKEYPILSEDSVLAARAALAVHRIAKDKYFDFHSALMNSDGKFEEKGLLEKATKLGIDAAKLKAEMEKPEVAAKLDENRKLGHDIGVGGTPALVINDYFQPGAVEGELLDKMIANVRAGRKADESAPAAAEAPAAVPAAAPAAAPAAN